jgi:hypothetical protein
MKKDAPRSSMTVKKWHDDGSCSKNCITFEQCIKYLYNTSNKQYASLPQVEELEEPEEAEEIREAGELKVAKKTLSMPCIKDIHQ